MNENLYHNLEMKHCLRFNSDNKFKIMMMSDLQEPLQYDKRTLSAIDKILECESPDLVILGGDNNIMINTEEELRRYLEIFTAPMESRKIPWAHIFGNHDYDIPFDAGIQQEIYESFPNCVSKRTPNTIFGVTNFVLPIKASTSDKIKFNVWGLDTNNMIKEMNGTIYSGDLEKDCALTKIATLLTLRMDCRLNCNRKTVVIYQMSAKMAV